MLLVFLNCKCFVHILEFPIVRSAIEYFWHCPWLGIVVKVGVSSSGIVVGFIVLESVSEQLRSSIKYF